jgi:hypothetical protein
MADKDKKDKKGDDKDDAKKKALEGMAIDLEDSEGVRFLRDYLGKHGGIESPLDIAGLIETHLDEKYAMLQVLAGRMGNHFTEGVVDLLVTHAEDKVETELAQNPDEKKVMAPG